MIGPRPTQVHDNPVAILLLFLKYVFKANATADIDMPIPIAALNNNISIFYYSYILYYILFYVDSLLTIQD